MRKLTVTCALLILAGNINAQTLFHYGKYPVDKKEFVRVYEKNAINQKPDYSRPALEEYLDLYSLFKMKVREAEMQQMDTISSIQYELGNYRKQLVKNYLTDDEVKGKLVKEAYNRLQENIKVAHIMIQVPPMAPAEDTVAPYKLIDSIYTAITKKGADFGEMAKLYSADVQTGANGGELGYVTALQTVYPFENAVYSTPVGKVSKPFSTQYGYHIVKVLDKRQAVGDIQVAQILIQAQKAKGQEQIEEARKEADMVYQQLKNGADFAKMVQEHSDDRFSKENNGELDVFGVGQMVPAFEKAAYALKNPGDISKPVQTDYGFHILKLVEKYPVPTYEEIKDKLTQKVNKDMRAEVARDVFYENVKVSNNYKEFPAAKNELKAWFSNIPSSGAEANKFSEADFKQTDKALFEVKGRKYMQSDLLSYAEKVTQGRLMGPREAIYDNIYSNYVRTVLDDIVEQNLIEQNEDFRNLMEEYRAGIMLFELMDRNVWGKASKDTVGLKEFHTGRESNYMWKPGFRGSVYTFKNQETLKDGLRYIGDKKMTDEDIMKKINSDELPDGIRIERGYYEFDKFDRLPVSEVNQGKASVAKKNEDGTYTVVYAENIYNSPVPKTLNEARGYVIADYQDYLEQKWNKELRAKYPVKLNEQEFNSLVK